MRMSSIAVSLIVAFMMLGLSTAPTHLGASAGSLTPAPVRTVSAAAGTAHGLVTTASPAPMTGFPRTVLVETFTGVWCHFCPAESQALYHMDHTTSTNVLTIAELHSCAFAKGAGPCLENYVPPDGTTDSRAAYYGVCGFPDVFFDGTHDACGAVYPNASTMETWYKMFIANASMFPGNVSISESAHVAPGNITSHIRVDSDLTGSYNAITYLLEYIGKRNVSNGYGPHDLANVVRATLFNHPISLTAGATTEYNVSGVLNQSWNDLNLSVITFVQQNSTKIVENANSAPVTTLLTDVSAAPSTVVSGSSTTVTVHVVNSSTNQPVVGAAVSLNASNGGMLSPASGVTGSDGSFSTTYTAPTVNATTSDQVTAQVSASGYTDGTATASLVLNPLVLSSVPTGLTVSPGAQMVLLNWTTPPIGDAGATYHVYRSTTISGGYAAIGVTSSNDFTDANLAAGQTYWYEVSTHNAAGFSANTSPVAASPVTATPDGLSPNVGWWLSVDSVNFTAPDNATLLLYLGDGIHTYQFGPDSYAFVASQDSGDLVVNGAPAALTASFTPRFAQLQGTVTPATATVSLDGTAVSVASDGTFLEFLSAGTYTLNVSASGYQTNVSSVTLTPGNTTPVTVNLHRLSTTPGTVQTSGGGGLTNDEMIAIIAIAAVVGVAAVLGGVMMMSKKGKGGGKSPRSPSE